MINLDKEHIFEMIKIFPNLNYLLMTKNLCFSFLLLYFSIAVLAQSPKRGIAYRDNSTADLLALKPGVSWWYN